MHVYAVEKMKPTVKTVRQNQNIILLGAENMTLEDVPADGDCLFHALSKQLHFCGITKSALEIRNELSSCIEDGKLKVSDNAHLILYLK